MQDDRIIKIILDYIKDDRYRQAILIDGEWGAGKTFFVKERLLRSLEEELIDKKIYYISLYGISSTKQIIDEIYSSMVGKIIEKKLGKESGEVVEKGISFTSKLLSVGMKYFNIAKEDLPQLSDVKDLKNLVVIFDDLERCEIEINQTLGIINNLVEHNDIKIILVANQDEIGKMNFSKDISNKYQIALNNKVVLDEKKVQKDGDKISYTKEQLIRRTEQLFAEDFFYKKVKEKLIGLTIYYQPNLADVFVTVIKNYIKNSGNKEYLLANKQKIVNMFEEKRHYNIRTLIFALIAFDKFYDVIMSIEYEKHEYIEEECDKILKYVLYSAIKIKCGETPYSWGNSSAKSGVVDYDRTNYLNRMYGYKFVDDYLLRCWIDEKEIKDTILEIVNEKKLVADSKKLEDSLTYRKLYSWWELEDDEIEEALKEILVELKDMKYKPRYFKDMIITLMQMEYQGFRCFEYRQFVDLMIQKIQNYKEDFNQRYLEVLSDDKDFISKYNEIVKPLFDILQEQEDEHKTSDNSFLSCRECWDDEFAGKCDKQDYLKDQKFFYYIDSDKLLTELEKAKAIEIYNFLDGIKAVYNFSNLYDFFKQDVLNLKMVVERMDIEKLSSGKKTQKIALEKLKKKMQESLELIENHK